MTSFDEPADRSGDRPGDRPGDQPDEQHQRPDGVDDDTVTAVDTLTRALETMEVARGHLLQWHRLTGTADTQLREAVDQLRAAGHAALADEVQHDLVGRNVIDGRWTFQVIEEYDGDYVQAWRRWEAEVRDRTVQGKRHLLEAEMKETHRTHGHPSHTARPGSGEDEQPDRQAGARTEG